MASFIHTVYARCAAWKLSEQHKRQLRTLQADARRAFTEHPEQTGETYLQHLWFTFTMSLRFLYTMLVLLIHGLFPFLLTRAASKQIEQVYRIMKMRIPKSQRDAIDADYSV
jgi:hypothetical protein